MSEKKWSELHNDVEITGIVKYWIKISKYLVKPFIILRLSPNFISLLTIVVSIPLIFDPSKWWLVVIALILDGIDGRVAIETNKATKSGAVIDSISDRVVEFIWGMTLHMAGLNDYIVFIFIGSAWIQEYLRSRAGGLGYRKIGIVTISERPTRSIFIALTLAVSHFASIILILGLMVQIIGLISLVRVFKKTINL